MVPREPEDISEDEIASSSDAGDEDSASPVSSPRDELNGASHDLEHVEEEYHTEESDEGVAEEENDDIDAAVSSAPLLPKELLKPLPSPAYSAHNAVGITRDQMTRPQKRAQRNRSRQAKKRVWERLRTETQGTGVVEAGKAAQIKRGVLPAKNRVKSGRVEKSGKTKVSGRQQLLERRKRQVDLKGSELLRPPKKSKSTTKR